MIDKYTPLQKFLLSHWDELDRDYDRLKENGFNYSWKKFTHREFKKYRNVIGERKKLIKELISNA